MSLLKKLLASVRTDEDIVKNKRAMLRDPEIRETLKRLTRAIGKHSHCLSVYYNEVTVNVTADKLDSFKVGDLPRLLGRLIDAGVEFDRTTDWPASGNRDYRGKIGRVSVTVSAYLSDSAKECTIKVVGERINTVPIYELVCA